VATTPAIDNGIKNALAIYSPPIKRNNTSNFLINERADVVIMYRNFKSIGNKDYDDHSNSVE